MATPILSAKKLYKEYRTGESTCIAVNHIDLDIEQGDFVSIVGASGSGKSSLIHLLAGLDDATSGDVYYKGTSVFEMNDKQRADYRGKEIGFVFQEGNLLGDLSVLKNIALPGYLYRKQKEVDEKALQWLGYMGLEEHKKKFPDELSGGQKQRVAIARALINEPKIIFLDEPTGSLDATAGENILRLLIKLNEKGQSIVMVTHDIGAAARGNKVIMIKDGSIYQSLDIGRYDSGKLEERKAQIYNL